MKLKTLAITLFAITLGSCVPLGRSVPTATAIPLPYQIINHENPNLQIDFSPFENFGCSFFPSYNGYRCKESSLLYTLGCTHIEETPLLGGLTPKYPIATCVLEIDDYSGVADIPDSCLYYNGGWATSCYQYVIYKDQSYQLVKDAEEFRELYAPIDSPDEALSFVLANDGDKAYYGQTKHKDYVYVTQVLEDTFVETIAEGYIVHVFHTNSDCEPFETRSMEIEVTHDGHLKRLNNIVVYNDSSQSGCE